MKYSHMLLITLIISLIWGILLFALGLVIRFNQAMLINRYIAGLDKLVNLDSCSPPMSPEINVCATQLEFDSLSLGSWADGLGSITIVTGVVIISLSACGFYGTVNRSQTMLIAMLILIIIGIGLEYYILDLILDGQSSYHADAREEMFQRLQEEYSIEYKDVNVFTKMLNAIMLMGECCGIRGPEDFKMNVSIVIPELPDSYHRIMTPPACCDREVFLENNRQAAFQDLMMCAADGWAIKSVQKGCYGALHRYVYDGYGGSLVGFLMFLILWEGVQGILLFMIILRPPPKSRKSTASSASARSMGRPTEPKVGLVV